MSNSIETVGNLFDSAIELEQATETLYRQIGKMFAHNHDVAQFWTQYADEERGHASYLERIKERVDIKRLSMPADGQMIKNVRKCLGAAAQKRLDSIQNLEDAYQLATELENSETNAIFEFMIVNFSTDELAKSQKFLRTQISTHIAKLEMEFPSRYKGRANRQNVAVFKQTNQQ